jgi:hypothetical protein
MVLFVTRVGQWEPDRQLLFTAFVPATLRHVPSGSPQQLQTRSLKRNSRAGITMSLRGNCKRLLLAMRPDTLTGSRKPDVAVRVGCNFT